LHLAENVDVYSNIHRHSSKHDSAMQKKKYLIYIA
jgi:hypothetical protein